MLQLPVAATLLLPLLPPPLIASPLLTKLRFLSTNASEMQVRFSHHAQFISRAPVFFRVFVSQHL
jgi:hypothetical protein